MEEVLYPEFPSQNRFYALGDCCPLWPNFSAIPFFFLKHIVDPKWLAWSVATTKCNLQGPTMSKKHQPINLGYFTSKIMQKVRHPSYSIKSNLTITSLIHTLGFKAFSIDQKQSLRAPQVQSKRSQSDSK